MATETIAWNNGSGNITLVYDGQGDGAIAVSSDPNDLGSARSQSISVVSAVGGITRVLTINQSACPVPVNTVLDFSYTGSVQSVLLPAGTYQLQCWGAQGGSNAAYSSYGISARAGGKGGYSVGQLTLASPTTLYIFVGGQGGSSGNGGWNGGGGGSGSSSYNSGNIYGVSRMGCGGGATDIALVTSDMSYSSYRTNRSSASLLSRIIVAGGGSGGAGTYRAVTTTTTSTVTDYSVSGSLLTATSYNGDSVSGSTLTLAGTTSYASNVATITDTHTESSSSTTTSNDYQVGYVGGGTSGGGYSSAYQGRINAAGASGGFGYGANMTTTNYRHCSGCGGGGWYGGGSSYSDDTITYVRYSGGGSGWVNTSANSSYRPTGYTGVELDSGTTYAGNTSFASTSGGTETGHSGNGYARITRLS